LLTRSAFVPAGLLPAQNKTLPHAIARLELPYPFMGLGSRRTVSDATLPWFLDRVLRQRTVPPRPCVSSTASQRSSGFCRSPFNWKIYKAPGPAMLHPAERVPTSHRLPHPIRSPSRSTLCSTRYSCSMLSSCAASHLANTGPIFCFSLSDRRFSPVA